MPEVTRPVTAAELEKYSKDDYRYELVEGRLIRLSPVGFEHARVVGHLCFLLEQHVRARNLGVVAPELGVKLAADPDTVRGPDVAFIRQERIPSPPPRGFWNGPPDLAIEVLSPDDRPSEVRAKVDEYLARGVALVLVVDPDEKTVTVWRPSISPRTLHSDDVLNLGDVIADFECRVQELFD